MRVIYFITGLGLGGAETITIDIANFMHRHGHKVSIVYLVGINELKAKIDQEIETIGLDMSKNPLGLITAIYKARKMLKNELPDVIHSNMVHSNLFTRLLSLFVKMPLLICTEHSKDICGFWRMFSYRITNCLSDINTHVSKEALNYFIEKKAFRANNSIVVYNGIDLLKFRKNANSRNQIRQQYEIPNDEFLFLNVGRLTAAKDQNNLLRAFAIMGKGKLMILGKGELENEIKRQVVNLNLTDKVILVGAKSNVNDYFNAADCFVLSSAWEGFGLVLAEAMATEVPAITTNAGGCAEVVSNEKWIVPIADSNALAEKMLEIFGMSQENRIIWGKQNREFIQNNFDINHVCEEWIKIYCNKV